MATVPGSDQAIIDIAKVASYLLSGTHPVGRAKARFFEQFGFRADAPLELAQALLAHVRNNEVADTDDSIFGTKYRVEGPVNSPDGRNPNIASVWIVGSAETSPRFITAFPC
ncbi:MAG: hypothetical protein HC868_12210 [Sphingomonadales bacterium]|nr:hypothetical protein [Sphingomonadales bacterium]